MVRLGMGRMRRTRAVVGLALALAGCGSNEYAPPPPPEVIVAHPEEREVTTYLEFAARTEAVEAVAIRARVQGTLQSIHFQPASVVKKGDLLFVIEPDLYRARVERAAADLASATAQAKAAAEQLEITKAIYERKAGSRADLVARTQARDQATAAIAQAKAALEAANLDLAYTHIYSPIDGRIDRNYVDAGNLVAAGEPTLLATVVRQDPIYAYYQASERELLEYRERQRHDQTAMAEGQIVPATLGLLTEDGFPHEGKIDYISNRVDPSTGTIEIRGVFDNPDGVLIPGLFARIRIPYTRGRALLVPELAIGTDQGGRFVYVVGKDDLVEQRRIKIGAQVDGERVVETGLTAEERIVVNGLQRARAGVKVSPREAPAKSAETSPEKPAA